MSSISTFGSSVPSFNPGLAGSRSWELIIFPLAAMSIEKFLKLHRRRMWGIIALQVKGLLLLGGH